METCVNPYLLKNVISDRVFKTFSKTIERTPAFDKKANNADEVVNAVGNVIEEVNCIVVFFDPLDAVTIVVLSETVAVVDPVDVVVLVLAFRAITVVNLVEAVVLIVPSEVVTIINAVAAIVLITTLCI
ncbi:hypothetical protein ACTXT7_015652 [Hymenolepis weldensis]